ncbi:MAG TPA: ribonuclease Z [Candidatus Saccharimonadales bacterium]
MNITMLGTGTGLIRRERRAPSVLIETSTGETAIADCGWGVPGAINDLGFPLHALTHLTISHRHADHVSALPALLQSQFIANIRHLPGEPRETPLTIHGYPGIRQDITTLCAMMIPELDVESQLIIAEPGEEVSAEQNLRITSMPVPHVPTMPAVSFCFEAEDKKVVFTGDTGWDENILTQLQDADIAIMDASASQSEYEEQPIRSHLAPVQCGQLAALAGVKHLILTSLYDRESAGEITAAVRQHYQGALTIPQDLQVFQI